MIVLTSGIYSLINLRTFNSIKCLNINLLLCLQQKCGILYYFDAATYHLFYSHYFSTVFILCKCYYKELVWVIPNSVWNFGYYKILCKMFFFPSQIYLKATFYTTQNFLYQLRFFILLVLLLNWNKTCCIDLFLPVLSSYWTSG